MKANWNNIEKLQQAVTSSVSRSEVLEKMGLKQNGGNHHTLKKYLKLYNINTSHFVNKSILVNARRAAPLSSILVKNSQYLDTNYLRKRLIRENVLPVICSGCGNTGTWRGTSLTLQLEHKNGTPTDHRIENLQLLCPNCHSQTSTWGNKTRE